jgi:hypothetical protein
MLAMAASYSASSARLSAAHRGAMPVHIPIIAGAYLCLVPRFGSEMFLLDDLPIMALLKQGLATPIDFASPMS